LFDVALILLDLGGMKQLVHLMGVVFACGVLTSAFAGTEMYSGKESKAVQAAPPPPMCEWGGFYVGLHAGGEFGHSQIFDPVVDRRFGFGEDGFNGGGQFGYNFQWHWLVLGPEFDVGYMDVDGRGREPGSGGTVHGETDSDFYTTLRGRVGVTLDWHGCWLIYGTGGAIGMDYTQRFHVDPNVFDARRSDFNWGYTVGGGIERRLTPHWSVKTEYLYFKLDDQSFGNTQGGVTARLTGDTEGHIVRAGLNYKF
jgi:outer membrane immunogenic protein